MRGDLDPIVRTSVHQNSREVTGPLLSSCGSTHFQWRVLTWGSSVAPLFFAGYGWRLAVARTYR